MKKNNALSYNVHLDEEIVVKVTPKNFGSSLFSVSANFNGKKLKPRPGSANAPIYDITIDDTTTLHTLILEFKFITGSPQKSLYEVAISGEDDVGCPCGFNVRKTTANKEPAVEFFVK